MKKILMCLLFLSFALLVKEVSAADFLDKVNFPKSPLIMGAMDAPSLTVKFNHASHAGVKCDFCHHAPRCAICHYSQELEKSLFASCSNNDGCHMNVGKSQESANRFMSFHKKNSERSCLGCHRSMLKEHPEFSGCNPCHPNKAAAK